MAYVSYSLWPALQQRYFAIKVLQKLVVDILTSTAACVQRVDFETTNDELFSHVERCTVRPFGEAEKKD